eukprot:2364249-Rhodomonas_salina.1
MSQVRHLPDTLARLLPGIVIIELFSNEEWLTGRVCWCQGSCVRSGWRCRMRCSAPCLRYLPALPRCAVSRCCRAVLSGDAVWVCSLGALSVYARFCLQSLSMVSVYAACRHAQ